LPAATKQNKLNFSENTIAVSPDGSNQKAYIENIISEIPKILLNKNEEILQIINKNLDLDADDEQILIVKMTEDINTPIKILVIDYDPVQGKHIRSWEYLTNSTNQRAFNIEFDDLIGDFNQEILFTGTTKNGETTFYAFRRVHSPSNLGIFFSPICQIVSDGTIRVNKIVRSDLYQIGQKNGKSFPIVVERRDKLSLNSLDLIQEEFDWNNNKGLYELVSSKPIPANEVEQNQLRSLFYSEELADFENFLTGPWYNKNDIGSIIVFSPDIEQLTFYASDIQEIYLWDYMKKTVYNGLLFIVRNQISGSIRKKINVTIKDLETIIINVGDINWDGTYVKVKEEFLESLFEHERAAVEISNIALKGFYEEENEEIKIIFEPPSFTMLGPDKENVIEGGFSITKNITILNNYYLKRKLRKVPKQISKEEFENQILKQINSYSSKKLLSTNYILDSKKMTYSLISSDPSNNQLSKIWDILLSIKYKGYINYQLGVLTLNIFNKNRIKSKVENYILEYIEATDQNRITKTIVLTPGEIGVKGIEAISDESLTFTQSDYSEN